MANVHLVDSAELASQLTGVVTDAIPLSGTTGTPVVRKPGDTRAGVFDWLVGAGQTGYLYHLRTTADSISSEGIFGIGIDAGTGFGMLFSIKGAGIGQRFEQSPAGGPAQVITAASTNAWQSVSIYNGSGGAYYKLSGIQPCLDGVSTAGSTTFTSATAAFTAGDVGATISLMPSVQTQFGGTTRTIASVTNASTVELDSAATETGSSIRFTISNRPASNSQIIDRAYDYDGTTLLYGRYKGYAVSQPFQARTTASIPLVAQGIASQTANLFQVQDSAATELFSVKASGNVLATSGLDLNNSNRTSNSATVLNVVSSNTTSRALVVKGNSQVDTVQLMDSGGISRMRLTKTGHLAIKINTVPDDADVANGEAIFYVDNTVGATKLMIKAKDSAGTVRIGSVTLS